MLHLRRNIAQFLWRTAIKGREVDCVDGITLVDVRRRGGGFRETMGHSLQLLREHDHKRYLRVKRHIRWIVNSVTKGGGASYRHGEQACLIEFRESLPGLDADAFCAWYAGTLVHESTHGVIETHGITYRGPNRLRIERLCVAEQNRFWAGLEAAAPGRYPLDLLYRAFDPADWQESWTAGPWKRAVSFLRRWAADRNTKPKPPLHDDPVRPTETSEATEGPPSES